MEKIAPVKKVSTPKIATTLPAIAPPALPKPQDSQSEKPSKMGSLPKIHGKEDQSQSIPQDKQKQHPTSLSQQSSFNGPIISTLKGHSISNAAPSIAPPTKQRPSYEAPPLSNNVTNYHQNQSSRFAESEVSSVSSLPSQTPHTLRQAVVRINEAGSSTISNHVGKTIKSPPTAHQHQNQHDQSSSQAQQQQQSSKNYMQYKRYFDDKKSLDVALARARRAVKRQKEISQVRRGMGPNGQQQVQQQQVIQTQTKTSFGQTKSFSSKYQDPNFLVKKPSLPQLYNGPLVMNIVGKNNYNGPSSKVRLS